MSRRSSPDRAERLAIEAIEVPLDGGLRDDYDRWARRAARVDGPRDEVTRFSEWYPACERRWLDEAGARGLWTASDRAERSDATECRRRAETVGHARREDGLVVHFGVEDREAGLVFRASHCRTVPVFRLARNWTEDQRLTWEEFVAGSPCRGCGRGFVGAPEWKPVMQRTTDEAAALEAEEADYRSLHPSCAAMSWRYGPTGVTHCSECCPPPPLSPRQGEQIARILADIVVRVHDAEAAIERRWAATATAPRRAHGQTRPPAVPARAPLTSATRRRGSAAGPGTTGPDDRRRHAVGYESFEITETDLRLDRAKLPALVAAARELGYLEGHEPGAEGADPDPELDALHDLLSELFPCNWGLDEDLRVSDLDFEWWPGERFPVDDVSRIFAAAATPRSSLTFLDFTEGDRDVFEVVFDGAGGHDRRYVVRDGRPVRAGRADGPQ